MLASGVSSAQAAAHAQGASVMSWTDFAHAVDAGVDDPPTELTEIAFKRALRAAYLQLGRTGFQKSYAGEAQLRIVPTSRLYVAVFVGQASATAHGKQGLHPLRIKELRDLGCPVWLVFCERKAVWSGWLLQGDGEPGNPDGILPTPISIAKDPGRKRQGWWCRDLARTEEIVFPESVPAEGSAATLFAG